MGKPGWLADEEWLKPAEAAAMWGITAQALRKRTTRQSWPSGVYVRTPGGHRRYRAEYFRRFPPGKAA
jgi:hypothetical protein